MVFFIFLTRTLGAGPIEYYMLANPPCVDAFLSGKKDETTVICNRAMLLVVTIVGIFLIKYHHYYHFDDDYHYEYYHYAFLYAIYIHFLPNVCGVLRILKTKRILTMCSAPLGGSHFFDLSLCFAR